MADADWLTMRHPSHEPNGATQYVSRQAFVKHWALKGWVEVDALLVKVSAILNRQVLDLNKDVTAAERAALEAQGIELPGSVKPEAERLSAAASSPEATTKPANQAPARKEGAS